MELDLLDTASFDLFECGAVFVNDRAGAVVHRQSCEVCLAVLRSRQRACDAETRRIVLTDR